MIEIIKVKHFVSHFLSDYGFKDTVVNLNCHLCMEGHLKIRLQSLYVKYLFVFLGWYRPPAAYLYNGPDNFWICWITRCFCSSISRYNVDFALISLGNNGRLCYHIPRYNVVFALLSLGIIVVNCRLCSHIPRYDCRLCSHILRYNYRLCSHINRYHCLQMSS